MALQRRKREAIGVKAPYPGFIEPALATTVDRVPSGKRWVHEIKFDGYRVQAHLLDRKVKVFTRRGHDWTNRFRKVAGDASEIAGEGSPARSFLTSQTDAPGPQANRGLLAALFAPSSIANLEKTEKK